MEPVQNEPNHPGKNIILSASQQNLVDQWWNDPVLGRGRKNRARPRSENASVRVIAEEPSETSASKKFPAEVNVIDLSSDLSTEGLDNGLEKQSPVVAFEEMAALLSRRQDALAIENALNKERSQRGMQDDIHSPPPVKRRKIAPDRSTINASLKATGLADKGSRKQRDAASDDSVGNCALLATIARVVSREEETQESHKNAQTTHDRGNGRHYARKPLPAAVASPLSPASPCRRSTPAAAISPRSPCSPGTNRVNAARKTQEGHKNAHSTNGHGNGRPYARKPPPATAASPLSPASRPARRRTAAASTSPCSPCSPGTKRVNAARKTQEGHKNAHSTVGRGNGRPYARKPPPTAAASPPSPASPDRSTAAAAASPRSPCSPDTNRMNAASHQQYSHHYNQQQYHYQQQHYQPQQQHYHQQPGYYPVGRPPPPMNQQYGYRQYHPQQYPPHYQQWSPPPTRYYRSPTNPYKHERPDKNKVLFIPMNLPRTVLEVLFEHRENNLQEFEAAWIWEPKLRMRFSNRCYMYQEIRNRAKRHQGTTEFDRMMSAACEMDAERGDESLLQYFDLGWENGRNW